ARAVVGLLEADLRDGLRGCAPRRHGGRGAAPGPRRRAGRTGLVQAHAREDVLERRAACGTSSPARAAGANRFGIAPEEDPEEVREVAAFTARPELVADVAGLPAAGRVRGARIPGERVAGGGVRVEA